MTVDELNALPAEAACHTLAACCGAPRWVSLMIAARPFAGRVELLVAADAAWRDLAPEERRSAFAHHPRIGESRAAVAATARAAAWSAQEQAGARALDGDARAELALGNVDYERRFGHPFIMFATGRSAPEMLEALRTRLNNGAATEFAVTSEELRKITKLRLEKLLDES